VFNDAVNLGLDMQQLNTKYQQSDHNVQCDLGIQTMLTQTDWVNTAENAIKFIKQIK